MNLNNEGNYEPYINEEALDFIDLVMSPEMAEQFEIPTLFFCSKPQQADEITYQLQDSDDVFEEDSSLTTVTVIAIRPSKSFFDVENVIYDNCMGSYDIAEISKVFTDKQKHDDLVKRIKEKMDSNSFSAIFKNGLYIQGYNITFIDSFEEYVEEEYDLNQNFAEYIDEVDYSNSVYNASEIFEELYNIDIKTCSISSFDFSEILVIDMPATLANNSEKIPNVMIKVKALNNSNDFSKLEQYLKEILSRYYVVDFQRVFKKEDQLYFEENTNNQLFKANYDILF